MAKKADARPPVEKVMNPELSPAPTIEFPSFPAPPVDISGAMKIKALRELLRDIQWNGPTVVHVMRRIGTCPECHSYLTHHELCRLAKEIG